VFSIAVGNGLWNGGFVFVESANEHSAAGPKPMWGRGRGGVYIKEMTMTHETTERNGYRNNTLNERAFRTLPLSIGQVFLTPGAQPLDRMEVLEALMLHQTGDWGNVGEDDWLLNNAALTDETRILSSYNTRSGVTFWIVTEADRSSTTVLLPCEY